MESSRQTCKNNDEKPCQLVSTLTESTEQISALKQCYEAGSRCAPKCDSNLLLDTCEMSSSQNKKNCNPDWKNKAFVEALTRISSKDDLCKDMKAFKKQLRKNEQLKDQINRQKGVQMGVVLEGQTMCKKIEMQAKTIEDLQEKMKKKQEELCCMQHELGEIVVQNKCTEENIELELQSLKKEETRLYEEDRDDHKKIGLTQVLSDMSMIQDELESEVDSMVDEMNRRKYENLQRKLFISFLECQKKHLMSELEEFEIRDALYQKQMCKLNKTLQQLNVDVGKSKQVARQQEKQLEQLDESICTMNKNKCVTQELMQNLDDKHDEAQSAKQDLLKQFEDLQSANDKLKCKNDVQKSELSQVNQLLQQELLVQQDAFGMKC